MVKRKKKRGSPAPASAVAVELLILCSYLVSTVGTHAHLLLIK